MDQTTLRKALYGVLDLKEQVNTELDSLISSADDNNEITFSKNSDGNIVCRIKYNQYHLGIGLTEKEVFKRVLNDRTDIPTAVENILVEKLFQKIS